MSAPETETYPSFEEAKRQGLRPKRSWEARCLSWKLEGILGEAVEVLQHPFDPQGDTQPYYTGEESWHPISQKAFFEPKVSSAEMSVWRLNEWRETWDTAHNWAAPGAPGCIFSQPNARGHRTLLQCDGEDRPAKGPKLLVQASGPYLTIHDYVSVVHPWLMSMRDNIVKAIPIADTSPLPAEVELYVVPNMNQGEMILPKLEWIQWALGGPIGKKYREQKAREEHERALAAAPGEEQ